MKVVAIKDFTLGGETHAKGEIFECDEMRGKAWVVAKVVREATAEDEAETLEDDPKVKRAIDEAEQDDDE
jgi:hypothetical protein